MRRNVEKVLKCFKEKKACVGDSGRTISTDGHVIYSYELPIAARGVNGAVYHLTGGHYSQTTAQQIGSLYVLGERRCTNEAGLRTVMDGEIPPVHFCGTPESAKRNLLRGERLPKDPTKKAELDKRVQAAMHDRLVLLATRRLAEAKHPKEIEALQKQLVDLDVEGMKTSAASAEDMETMQTFEGASRKRRRRRR